MSTGKEVVLDFFKKKFDAHGDNVISLGWSKKGQQVRFDQVVALLPKDYRSILDIGCGFGDFSVRVTGDSKYEGWDICDSFLNNARQGKNISYQLRDFLSSPPEENLFDVVICVGAFNINTGSNIEDIKKVISSMLKGARHSAVISMISSYADDEVKKNPEMFFYIPEEIFRYCKSVCRNVDLFHGYMPHDFMIRLTKV